MDKEWNFLKSNINRITYSNLSYGNYQLIISKLERDGQPSNRPHILNIRILPPWYYTIWAKASYILLLLSLIAWTINFFRVKNRLKAERREKEKILERQYDNHIAILEACKEGDCNKICQEVKKHYWTTIFRMLQDQKLEESDLKKSWMMAI